MAPIQRVKREFPPKHFSMRIESFSKLVKACDKTGGKYESALFNAEGCNWKLILYPNGNTNRNGKDHISLYLAISEFPANQDVHVRFEFFVFDQNEDNYLGIYDGTIKRFHKMKTEWGFHQSLELTEFKGDSKGYLVNDACEFGVELFVVSSKTQKQQIFKLVKPSSTQTPFRTTFRNFSNLGSALRYGDTLTFGGKTWRLHLYPKGFGTEQDNSLSLFLELMDAARLAPDEQVWAEYKLRVIDQRQDNHKEKTIGHWFSRTNTTAWGFPDFMPLGDLSERRKGFVMSDILIVEVEFIDVSVTTVF